MQRGDELTDAWIFLFSELHQKFKQKGQLPEFSSQIFQMEIASEDLYTSAERFVEVTSFDAARWNPRL